MVIDRYLIKHFIPVFMLSLSMFVMFILLLDLFMNLVNYLNYNATFEQIMTISYYYIPKSISYSLPVSLLFAVAYTLGELCARNELTSVIASGIPFWRFGITLIFAGILVSVFSFFFDDRIVIPSLKAKNELSRKIKHQENLSSNSEIAIKTKEGNRIYYVDYYDYTNLILNGVIVVNINVKERTNGRFESMIRAQSAKWDNGHWNFSNADIYNWVDGILRVSSLPPVEDYSEEPELFRRSAIDPAELSVKDAKYLIGDLKMIGLPYIKAEADYYHRFSFSAVSFIVVILSISMGGRFRKNVLLMSLLTSILISVIYYVMEMVSMTMANSGYIMPIIGAWFPVVFFTLIGLVLLRYSRT